MNQSPPYRPVANRRPRILDPFCCAGGAARGYEMAGFDSYGIDINPQPRYAGTGFHQGNAIDVLRRLVAGLAVPFTRRDGTTEWLTLADFAAAHGSPPCQAWCDLQKQSKRFYEDFIEPCRELFIETGLPYVIENVEGAPLLDPVVLCGTQFPGLRVIRHRLFETNWHLEPPPTHPKHPLVFTHDKRKAHYGQLNQDESFVQVTGGGNCTIKNAKAAMGIDWMNKHELNEALPPAYTEWIGRQLMVVVRERRVAA